MKCPTCKKTFEGNIKDKHYPFCCSTCKMSDLYGWLNEEFYIPCENMEEEEDDK